jgi:7tm Chemosensory receptor
MLTDALRPFSKLTYWCGVLPDWCCSSERHLLSRVINTIGILCSMITMLILAAYETFQLCVEVKRMNSIHSIMVNLLWFSIYPVAITVQLRYLICRKRMMDFFQNFRQLERQPLILQYPARYSWICGIAIVSYMILTIGSVAATSEVIFNQNSSVFMTHHAILCDLFTPTGLGLFHVAACVYTGILGILMDVVPALIFYHSALALKSLESAILQHFVFTKLRRTSKSVKYDWIRLEFDKLWLQYEDIRTVVDQANRLFGLVVLLKDGVYFLATCILTYMVFYRLKSLETNYLFIAIYAASVYSFRSVMSTLMAAQLHQSWRQLSATFSSLISRNWTLLTDEERKMAEVMMNCVQTNRLIARPCDLYDVNYTFLLRVLSFTATYVIIILQSK